MNKAKILSSNSENLSSKLLLKKYEVDKDKDKDNKKDANNNNKI